MYICHFKKPQYLLEPPLVFDRKEGTQLALSALFLAPQLLGPPPVKVQRISYYSHAIKFILQQYISACCYRIAIIYLEGCFQLQHWAMPQQRVFLMVSSTYCLDYLSWHYSLGLYLEKNVKASEITMSCITTHCTCIQINSIHNIAWQNKKEKGQYTYNLHMGYYFTTHPCGYQSIQKHMHR